MLTVRSNSTQLNLSLIIMPILHNSRKVAIATFACVFVLQPRLRLQTNLDEREGERGITISYYVNKLFFCPVENMSPPKGGCCECFAKIFENTRIYISSHIFLARLRQLRAGWRIFIFRIYRFTVARKSSWNIFGAGLSVLRRDDLGKHFIAFDTMVKNAQGSDSKKCNW